MFPPIFPLRAGDMQMNFVDWSLVGQWFVLGWFVDKCQKDQNKLVLTLLEISSRHWLTFHELSQNWVWVSKIKRGSTCFKSSKHWATVQKIKVSENLNVFKITKAWKNTQQFHYFRSGLHRKRNHFVILWTLSSWKLDGQNTSLYRPSHGNPAVLRESQLHSRFFESRRTCQLNFDGSMLQYHPYSKRD